MLQWDFLHSFPIFLRGEWCVRSGFGGKTHWQWQQTPPLSLTHSPPSARVPGAPPFPLPWCLQRCFPPFGSLLAGLCRSLALQGRRLPGPSPSTCCCASASQRRGTRSPCCLQHPPGQILPQSPGSQTPQAANPVQPGLACLLIWSLAM